jgi:stage V sporulation protein R
MMPKKTKKQLKEMFSRPEWTIDTLYYADEVISRIAKEYLKLDIYHNVFEIVTSEQLLDRMSLIGLPIGYDHWSFGKHRVSSENQYKRGKMGLSYEMVINSDPCISYNIEENTTCLMLLVMAHAAQGHNSFFKNNYLFKMWTSADAIVDYMNFAKKYIKECEEAHGLEEVEMTLDACHALMQYGVDKYKHPPKLSVKNEQARKKRRIQEDEQEVNEMWRTLPRDSKERKLTDLVNEYIKKSKFPKEPVENMLYFFEKHSPNLEPWQREICRIVRKVAQYFYPQAQTKTSNEGWATYCHHKIINKMYDEGYLSDGFMMEFIEHHTAVVAQPEFLAHWYYGFNPYALGFNIYKDIERICTDPTEEDKRWFPNLIGKNWLDEVHYAMNNFKDEGFLMQYLSPKVMRDMKLFDIVDDDSKKDFYEIQHIHNDNGYKYLRESLNKQFMRDSYTPDIQIENVNKQDHTLGMVYYSQNEMMLDEDEANIVMEYVYHLWGYPVVLEHQFEDGDRETICDIGVKGK